jgi:hypothetical protein
MEELLGQIGVLIFSTPLIALGWQTFTWLKTGVWISLSLWAVLEYTGLGDPWRLTHTGWVGLDKILADAFDVWFGWYFYAVAILMACVIAIAVNAVQGFRGRAEPEQ